MNVAPKDLLARHRFSKVDVPVFLPLALGFLRLDYDPQLGSNGQLTGIAFVAEKSKHARPIGKALVMQISEQGMEIDESSETATFIGDNDVSGTQWRGGAVSWGATYDDVPSTKVGEISLGAWVDECVEKMINPGEGALGPILSPFDLEAKFADLKAGVGDAPDRFWKECVPKSERQVALIFELVEHHRHDYSSGDNFDLGCFEALKRAIGGLSLILDKLTGFVAAPGEVSDANERFSESAQEILQVHATAASEKHVQAWLELCSRAWELERDGAFSHYGPLFVAVGNAPGPWASRQALIEEVVTTGVEGSAYFDALVGIAAERAV